MKFNVDSRRKSHHIILDRVIGEKVHKRSPQGTEVSYSQPRLLAIILRKKQELEGSSANLKIR